MSRRNGRGAADILKSKGTTVSVVVHVHHKPDARERAMHTVSPKPRARRVSHARP